jgi:hypothetical protein
VERKNNKKETEVAYRIVAKIQPFESIVQTCILVGRPKPSYKKIPGRHVYFSRGVMLFLNGPEGFNIKETTGSA